MKDDRYMKETRLLDFNRADIQELVKSRGWNDLQPFDKIGAVYGFVKDEIMFGYNKSDDIPASRVLQDGYGQCNTKSTLLTALLRSVGVPCRIHAFRVDKQVQQGIIPPLFYRLSPPTLLHTWVEVMYEGRWVSLEGCILDERYLSHIQETWSAGPGNLCGYGVAVKDLRNPSVAWNGADTAIQAESIVEDLGFFDSPDELYRTYGANLNVFKRFIFKYLVRKFMNKKVAALRGGNACMTAPHCFTDARSESS